MFGLEFRDMKDEREIQIAIILASAGVILLICSRVSYNLLLLSMALLCLIPALIIGMYHIHKATKDGVDKTVEGVET